MIIGAMRREEFIPDTFTASYIKTMLWASTDDNDEPLDANYDMTNFADETLAKIKSDCDAFNSGDTYDMIDTNQTRAGHNFWLTRNYHGAGFWDGRWPEHGDKLTKISQSYSEQNLYVGDDGKLYLSP